MRGLVYKDFMILLKTTKPIVILGFIPVLFVSMVNPSMIIFIVPLSITFLFALQVITSMSLDEACKWQKYLIATPLPPLKQVLSKYITQFLLSILSTILIFGIGMIAVFFKVTDYRTALLVLGLAFVYGSLYGFLMIPTSYRFGSANSRYFFMLFILIPTFIPIILQAMHIELDINTLHINVLGAVALLLLFYALAFFISLFFSHRIVKNIKNALP